MDGLCFMLVSTEVHRVCSVQRSLAWNMAGILVVLTLLLTHLFCSTNAEFSDNIDITWSQDHIDKVNAGNELQLKLDNSSGSGFKSKDKYLFGKISMDIKLVPGESAGTVTSFYIVSETKSYPGPNYYEFDFEFLGNTSGEPYVAQTNVYAGGKGGREQRIYLWFDPTADFHTYSFLWNKQHVVFFVDSTPVRVFAKNEARGVPYPSAEPMAMYSSIWNGEDWATRGGLVKTDWKQAPFVASFRNFSANACVWSGGDSQCSGVKSWEDAEYQVLHTFQASKLNWVKKNYMVYDYCIDSRRYPTPPAECV